MSFDVAKKRKIQIKDYPSSRKPYIPDLSAFMSLCDANYAKLMQLLPDFEQQDIRVFGLSRSQHELGRIRIEVLERCKYTTSLEISQENVPHIVRIKMEVRLYHDARMAEVLSYQGMGKLKARYHYPNDKMLQKDEKALCNEFLADWLSYCLKFGHSSDFEAKSTSS